MNALQISELKRRAKNESISDINRDKSVYVLIKNGTNFGHITTNKKIVQSYVVNDGFSIYAIYKNGSIVKYELFKSVYNNESED